MMTFTCKYNNYYRTMLKKVSCFVFLALPDVEATNLRIIRFNELYDDGCLF